MGNRMELFICMSPVDTDEFKNFYEASIKIVIYLFLVLIFLINQKE
jgi:hypothetical protein